jgi:hypothetical protein
MVSRNYRQLRASSAQVTGPASYVQYVASDTVTTGELVFAFNDLKVVDCIGSVNAWAQGYIVIPRRVCQGHIVKCQVYADAGHGHAAVAFTGNALATHQHNITTVGAAGGGKAMTEPVIPGPLETAGAGQANTNAVDAASAGTPAGTNAATVAVTTVAGGTSSELSAAENISGVTFYATARW